MYLKKFLKPAALEKTIHITFWVLFFLSIRVKWSEPWIKEDFLPYAVAPHFALILPLLFYTNGSILLPKYFKKKIWPFYFIYLIVGIVTVETLRSIVFTSYLDTLNTHNFVCEFQSKNSFIFGPLNVLINATYVFSCLYYFIKRFVKNQIRIKELATENLQMQLIVFKAQFDPHFLFNNLNALDSLIIRDPPRAQRYLQKLAQLYRYNLEANNKNLALVEEEIAFAKAYTDLLKERYDDLYEFCFEDELIVKSKNFKIPFGSLQTLLENVVKHNGASASTPLKTKIFIDCNYLVVSNPINIRKKAELSSGKGLTLLRKTLAQYTPKPLIVINHRVFEVRLPLIKN